MNFLKNIVILIFIWVYTPSNWAQDFTSDWVGHFSYNQVRDVVEGNGNIYGASENAVFIFSTLNGTITTLSTVNGLSGNIISAIHFSESFNTLLIGYENGIMDVVVGNNSNIITVIDIFNRPAISPDSKRINHFNEFNGFAYISTGFGITLYDLARLEFDDTYFIGDNGGQINVTQTAVQEEFIYASSTEGDLRRAIVSDPNIIDFNNWTTVFNGTFQGITPLNNTLFLTSGNQVLRSSDGSNFVPFLEFSEEITDLEANEEFLSITSPSSAQVYDTNGTLLSSFSELEGFSGNFTSSIIENNILYLATSRSGIASISLNDNTQINRLLPNGPLENNIFSLDASPGSVYAAFGDYTVTYNPFPLKIQGISKFSGSRWTNIPVGQLLGARNLTNITINPNDPTHVFVSSFRDGLLELSEDVPLIRYDANNSSFDPVPTTTDDTRINSTAFDREGNLWIANARGLNTIHRLSPSGQFTSISLEDVLAEPTDELGSDDIVVAPDGKIYLGTSDSGIIGYDPDTGQAARLFGEDGAANLPIDDIRALEFDRNGTLWIGTRRGLRILFSPASIFEEGQTSTNAIIILQDDIPQELLNDQVVTDILVDGANNKWVATTDSGVFQFSPNGQETLQHFTTLNSPLPSNNVQDIAIDEESGTVYFGTLRGLVAFQGEETAPAEDLENVIVFPNPVRPGFNGNIRVENLTANTNVKITDVVGNLVHEETTTGGSISWDTTAFGRHRVASGVYFILITGPQAVETQIAKLMIIR